MSKARILVVEDDPDGRRSVVEAVEDCGMAAGAAAGGEEGLRLFREQPFDAALVDLVLPDIDGVEVMNRLRALDPNLPVVIMTAYGSVDSAVRALKAGAYDYIPKPLDLDEVQNCLGRAVEAYRLRTEVRQLQRNLETRYGSASIIGRSKAMQDVLGQIRALTDLNATVLIQGESGTGKELVARALHYDGKRRDKPFVAVNCGAFTETLLESELFGHEKGAFTGAVGRHLGAFERADGGTLFLDEVGDAPRPVQVKLLRVIEEREIVRVGGRESVRVDVRLVSATNRDLDELVKDGQFRKDLLYRLKVVSLRVPALRERPEDIRPLAEHFMAAACRAHGRHMTGIHPAAYERLERHAWPGNIRELRNVLETAVIMARGPVLTSDDVRCDPAAGAQAEWTVPDGMTLADLECDIFRQLLARNEGNRTLVAEKLGISRRTIQRKIQEYRLPF